MKPFICFAWRGTAAAIVFAALPLSSASAATIVGGSNLLTAASADQLETWLGQGPTTLTNIFDKAPGNTPDDFHAAADGMGATFSVIEVLGFYNGELRDQPVLIGGYNPQSWSSSSDYNVMPLDADRTAFVFNLTQGLKFDQRKDAVTTNRGRYQTLNSIAYGPTFGAGHDLTVGGVDATLNTGYSYLYSYGGDDAYSRDLARYPTYFDSYVQIGQIEVFTVTPGVPEPETYALMLAGLSLLGVAARRKGSRQDHIG